MKLNGITKIKDDAGKYIVLGDYGGEGLHVEAQYDDLEAALCDSFGRTVPTAVVCIAEVYEPDYLHR